MWSLGTQNLTEGVPPRQLAACDVICVQEVHRRRFKEGLPDRYRTYFPKKTPGLAIAWDPRVLEDAKPGAIRFHDSGKAEGWPFPSPARGVAYVKGLIHGQRSVVFNLWLLNSHTPMKPDHHTAMRHAIVMERCWPILRKRVRLWHQNGWTVYGAGDGNTIKGELTLPYLWQPWGRGLDRIWLPKDARVELVRAEEGPKTGVGSQMKHGSKLVTLRRTGAVPR